MLKKMIDYFKLFYIVICLAVTSLLVLIFNKKESYFRKKCAKKIVSLLVDSIEIEGEIDHSANLFIGNHTDNLDIAIIESIFEEKIIWVAKYELSKIPIYKYLVTKTDLILTKRDDKRSIIRLIRDVKDRVSKGYKVFIFPEGTRNRENYKNLLEFKKGVKVIAEKLNLKVQPFVIINVPKVYDLKPLKIHRPKIKIIFLKSFYPYDNWYEEVKVKMEEVLKKEYNEK